MNACKVLELVSNDKIEELKRLAELEIKERVIKEKGGNKELKRFKSAQKYIKNAEKCWTVEFKGTWEENGKQCFSDGYTGFILENKIEGLEKIENQVLDLHKALECTSVSKEIKVDINEIKTAVKIYKSTHKRNAPPFEYDLGISRYNAEYIISCYDILGGNIVFKQSETNEISPAILESENGIAILLPMKKRVAVCN